uniref:Ig-like domain-containing protein n=1 Tax=Fundulus heteroclitus TaxID=8078 RepID=A0A3Q2PCN8_FUNHE
MCGETNGRRDEWRDLHLHHLCSVLFSPAGRTVSAVVGGDVTLPCKADWNQPLEVVEWSKPGTITEFVLILRSPNPDIVVPLPSYEGRVELKDRETGDMSLVLRNVRDEDGGMYQCYVLREGSRRKRAEPQPISTTNTCFSSAGRGHLGAIVVVVLVVLAAGAAVCLWKKKKSLHPPSSHSEGVDTSQV